VKLNKGKLAFTILSGGRSVGTISWAILEATFEKYSLKQLAISKGSVMETLLTKICCTGLSLQFDFFITS
jgi:hypothetical protein